MEAAGFINGRICPTIPFPSTPLSAFESDIPLFFLFFGLYAQHLSSYFPPIYRCSAPITSYPLTSKENKHPVREYSYLFINYVRVISRGLRAATAQNQNNNMARARIRHARMQLLLWAILIWHVSAQSRILAVYSSSGTAYGPFGPWTAPEIRVGTGAISLIPFYPRTTAGSLFYSSNAGGSYLPARSTTAKPNGTTTYIDSLSQVDDTRGELQVYYDIITVGDNPVAANISMGVVNKIVYYGKYQGVQGSHGAMNWIGFGYGLYREEDPSHVDPGFEFIHELKANRSIGSKSFGFHLGVAGFARSKTGSLTLGGYERNRVLGQPAVFDWPISHVFVVDILVGVQLGDSPFELITGPTSVFEGPDDEWEHSEAAGAGGKAGSVLVRISPEMPHMGLPARTCNALAQHVSEESNYARSVPMGNTRLIPVNFSFQSPGTPASTCTSGTQQTPLSRESRSRQRISP